MAIFYPDQADYRRQFEEERDHIRAVVQEAKSTAGPSLTIDERFYAAWCHHPRDDAARFMSLIGADEFSRLFAVSLRQAKQWIERIIRDHLSNLATVLDPIDEVASGGTPDLMRWARGELGTLLPNGKLGDDLGAICPIADRWGDDHDLLIDESLRVLTLASKIRRLEAVDGWEYVTRDMTRINELCSERLWEGRKMVLMVNYAVQKAGDRQGYVHPDVPITFGSVRAAPTWDSEVRTIPVKCRVVTDGGRLYLVLTKSRPKDIEATILKEEELESGPSGPRCRAARDRRGIMHVLVAVGERGDWRVAVPKDCEAFEEVVRSRLWRTPLVLEDHAPWKNPESNPDYRRVKLLGRLHRRSYRSDDLEVHPSVEHQIIAIETLLSSLGAKTTLNHDVYRHERIRRVLVTKLFEQHFNSMKG